MTRIFAIIDSVDTTTTIIAAGILLLVVAIIDRRIQEGT